MNIAQLTSFLENIAPPSLQESYDNSGLIVGEADTPIQGVLVSLDCTEEIIEEAIDKNCNLIVAHHPIVFKGLKKLNGKNYVERTIIKAIQNNIAIYAIHTNLDNVLHQGVNEKIAQRIGLENTRILEPKSGLLNKLTFFTPEKEAEKVTKALFDAGAGHIGAYDCCSFNSLGTGTFRASENANPYVGKAGEIHKESEIKTEVVVPEHKLNAVLQALNQHHPYEEVAYFIQKVENKWATVGSGLIGELQTPMTAQDFLVHLKKTMQATSIAYTQGKKEIKTVAVCGGSGSFLIGAAKRQKADAYVTSDIKYHEYFDGEGRLMLCNIGHYESEQFTIDLLKELISQKFSNFAVISTARCTNPVHYYF